MTYQVASLGQKVNNAKKGWIGLRVRVRDSQGSHTNGAAKSKSSDERPRLNYYLNPVLACKPQSWRPN